jgi:asparagine synthase (glutamine-hydrolysing)
LLSLPKKGFSAPIGHWIKGPCADQYRDEVLRSNSRISQWLDVDRVRGYFNEHCRGAVDHSQLLWTVWVLERWANRAND